MDIILCNIQHDLEKAMVEEGLVSLSMNIFHTKNMMICPSSYHMS